METTINTLLNLLAEHGGKIVSTASLEPIWINQARESGRMYVDENSLGFVWEPDIKRFPQTEIEIDFFDKWFPLHHPLPDKLKNANFLFNKSDVYGHCTHGENMVTCQICNPYK